MDGVADGTARKLAFDSIVDLEVFVDFVDLAVVEKDRFAFMNPALLQKHFVHMGFNVDQKLVNSNDISSVLLAGVGAEGDAALVGNGEVMFAFTFAGKFHKDWIFTAKWRLASTEEKSYENSGKTVFLQ